MIAVDTSAIVAIALKEPDHPLFLERLRQSRRAIISSVSLLETRMVVYGRLGHAAVVLLDDMFRAPAFVIQSPGPIEMEAAWNAFVVFGKGSGHPAGLNFGDIFAYAIAKTQRIPLLFKGRDFSFTDIEPALPMPEQSPLC